MYQDMDVKDEKNSRKNHIHIHCSLASTTLEATGYMYMAKQLRHRLLQPHLYIWNIPDVSF